MNGRPYNVAQASRLPGERVSASSSFMNSPTFAAATPALHSKNL
jgi:hypothetical protein